MSMIGDSRGELDNISLTVTLSAQVNSSWQERDKWEKGGELKESPPDLGGKIST
jgi:hypothetical protein